MRAKLARRPQERDHLLRQYRAMSFAAATTGALMAGPLTGVRIIDLTSVILGPYGTQVLADFGADVIKVEPPEGDVIRHAAPLRHSGMGHIFLHHNRNKRSIMLDLKQPQARDALLRLIAGADALLHNSRPQAMARLKLSYDDVKAVNDRIVYVAAYGYSERGPYAGRPAYDDLIQGMVAIPSIFETSGGESPRFVPSAIADRVTGLSMAHALTAALYYRERTGHGQAIEVPMFETMAELILSDHMGGHTFDPPAGPPGYPRMLAPHRAPYKTSDGYVCVLIYIDKQWRAFFKMIGREAMMDDPRFASQEARSRNIAEVYAFVAEQLVSRTSAEWLAAFAEADIPATPLNTLDDLIADPHLHATGFFRREEHPSEGTLRTMGVPSTWSESQPEPRLPAPRLGEHSMDILREAGCSESEIAAMIESGATSAPGK
jgi:crotonobetainyl-CoA:carnitine CoA-transferase CaiB-like acyl-CoA transferase